MGDNPRIVAEKLAAYTGILNSADFISELQASTDMELCREKISIGGTISADEVDEFLKTEDSSMTSSEEIDALLGG